MSFIIDQTAKAKRKEWPQKCPGCKSTRIERSPEKFHCKRCGYTNLRT